MMGVSTIVTPGEVCHHTMLSKCCNASLLLREELAVVPGGSSVNVSGEIVQVTFLYSGGGYGSRQPLSKLCAF